MNNIIIMGSGRSGTSLTTGLFAEHDYFMGTDLIPSRPANPKGFFECRYINNINERLLAPFLPKSPKLIGKYLFRKRLRPPHRWLARIPVETELNFSHEMDMEIQELTASTPYCFKDPRFSYTLPAWRPFLSNLKYVCVFRHPLATARSMVNEHKKLESMNYLKFNFQEALDVWKYMHQHILEKHMHQGDWHFIHFEQIFSLEGIIGLEEFAGVKLNRDFPNKKFNRSSNKGDIDEEYINIYKKLCDLAGFEV